VAPGLGQAFPSHLPRALAAVRAADVPALMISRSCSHGKQDMDRQLVRVRVIDGDEGSWDHV
jgi:hypothetical protein